MDDLILLGIIVGIIALALGYIIHAKRSGVKCIGCSSGKKCSGSCGSCHCDSH